MDLAAGGGRNLAGEFDGAPRIAVQMHARAGEQAIQPRRRRLSLLGSGQSWDLEEKMGG